MVETSGSVLHLNHPYNATRVNAGKIDVRVAELQKAQLLTMCCCCCLQCNHCSIWTWVVEEILVFW